MSEPKLRIEGLTVRYDAVTALDRVNLDVGTGAFFVLLGGSGSGKTTLLRAIAGFLRPDAGRIALDGADLAALPPHKRPVNTMFQSYALFPHMSVAANVGFGLRRRKLTRRETEARVEEMLALVQLAGYGGRRPDALSGGQQQRVALARSLAPRPKLLLLDEPLSALDRNLREQTREELVQVQRRLGTTFIMVTHDQQEALSAATQIGVMHAGRLVQTGTPAEVYERPRTVFVAHFLGTANILNGTVREGGTVTLRSGQIVRVAEASRTGADVALALRPERVRIAPAEQAGTVPAILENVTYAGDSRVYALRLDDGTPIRSRVPAGTQRLAGPLSPGARVGLVWDEDAPVLLEQEDACDNSQAA